MVTFSDLEKTEERIDLDTMRIKSSLCGILNLSCLLDIQVDLNMGKRLTGNVIWKPSKYQYYLK